MAYLVLALLVLLVIGLMVVAILARHEWRWFHVTSAITLMILCVIFLFPTAASLKARSTWHELYEGLEKQLATLEQEQRQLKYGDPTNASVGEGVLALTQRLAKSSLESGRRWRSLRRANVANNQVTLVSAVEAGLEGVPLEPPADGEEPVEQMPLAQTEMVVYGFAEQVDPDTQLAIPTVYLGEYRVVSSTPNQVVVEPTAPLNPVQLQSVNQSQQWSLFELLPLDSHDVFLAAGSKPSEDNVLGRVDNESVARNLGNRVTAETLQSYLDDGRRLLDKDPPLARWMKVEFLKPFKIQVDAPGKPSSVIDRGFFDGSGRALDARLKRGDEAGSVEFAKGDTLLVKEEAGQPLVKDETVKLIDRFYLRPLNDYRFILRRIQIEIAELRARIEELNFENTILDRTIDTNNGMIVREQERKVKLEQDEQQFTVEHNAIKEYVAQLEEKTKAIKQRMRQLHQSNLELEAQLTAVHRQVELQTSGN